MNAAGTNARRLAADARLLLDAGRHPTAASLAALSIEESGKIAIIRGLTLQNDPKALREEWRRYRDHRSKNGLWILPKLIAEGARLLHEMKPAIDKNGEHTALLNSIKQLGLYTDCYGQGHWSTPWDVVDEALSEDLVETAELLAPKKDVTARELELWVDIMGPSYCTEGMPMALIRWAAALYQEGLSDTTPEEYVCFVFGSYPPTSEVSDPAGEIGASTALPR